MPKQAEHPLYRTWTGMKSRCYNENHIAFVRYGGRGIRVCDRWHAFSNFAADMGERPEGMTLDRIDNDGNYEPSNCRWATRSMQMRNRNRFGKKSKFKGVTRSRNRWRAQITSGGETKCIGIYDTELEAAHAYDTAAVFTHGTECIVNFSESKK